MVPVIDAGADDDRALAVRVERRLRPLAREPSQRLPTQPRVLLRPGRCVRRVVVVADGIVTRQPARHPVLSHEEIVDRGDQDGGAVGGLQPLRRNASSNGGGLPEVVELDLHYLVAAVEEAEDRIDGRTVLAVFELQVPLALRLAPAVTDASHGHPRTVVAGVPHEELPVPILDVSVWGIAIGSQVLRGAVAVVRLAQFDQDGRIGVLLGVVQEVGNLLLVVILLEKDVVDGHPPGPVLSRVDRHPLVRVLRHLIEVGGEHPHLAAVVPRLRREVTVRRAGHVEIRSHDREELGVVPIRRFVDVRLFAPGLRRCGRKVAVPVVE